MITLPPVPSSPGEALDALPDENPFIQLPGDDRLIGEYAADLAGILRPQPIFYRNGELVGFDIEGKKLVAVQPEQLRTLVEHYCTGFEGRGVGKKAHGRQRDAHGSPGL